MHYVHRSYIIIYVALALSGCIRFQPTQIKKEMHTITSTSITTPNVHVSVQMLQPDHPSPSAQDLLEHTYLFSLSITNKTANPISPDPTMIKPHIMQSQEFAQLIAQSYGCYFIPALVLGCTGFLFLWQVGLPLAGLFTLFGINQSRRATEHTITSFSKQALSDTPQTIPPQSTRTFLLAIAHKHYQPTINLMIQTKDSIESYTLTLKKTTLPSYTCT